MRCLAASLWQQASLRHSTTRVWAIPHAGSVRAEVTGGKIGDRRGLAWPYEGDLIRVAGDLDAGAHQQGGEAYFLLHISALKPRKASFLDDLNDYQANHNLPLFTETDLPIERVKAVDRG
jgi:hypothetical protein